MTLLTIANAIADETKGPRPETIAENTNTDARNILRLINRVGYKLMLTYPFQILRAEHTITADGSETLVSAANMPAQFNRIIPETFWDRSSNNLVSGPVSAVEWNGLKVQTFSSQNKKFYYRAGAILTQPTFDSGTSLAFEYVKNGWVDTAAGGANKSAFTIDTDVSEIDEELIIAAACYAWLDSEGLPSMTAFQHFKDMFDRVTEADQMGTPIMVTADMFAQHTRHFEGAPQASRASYGGDF